MRTFVSRSCLNRGQSCLVSQVPIIYPHSKVLTVVHSQDVTDLSGPALALALVAFAALAVIVPLVLASLGWDVPEAVGVFDCLGRVFISLSLSVDFLLLLTVDDDPAALALDVLVVVEWLVGVARVLVDNLTALTVRL